MPVCKTCGETKGTEGFHKSLTCVGGVRPVCKQCVSVGRKQYREANKELLSAQKRAYRERNLEKIRAKDAEYYAANKERCNANSTAWYERNKSKALADVKTWQEANPEKVKAAKRKNKQVRKDTIKSEYQRNKPAYFARAAARRVTVKQATPVWSDKNAIADVYVVATKLNAFFTKPLVHVDHIVPLNNQLVCGLHTEANLQVISAKANLSKRNRHWPDMP